jgi:hypothetical protein
MSDIFVRVYPDFEFHDRISWVLNIRFHANSPLATGLIGADIWTNRRADGRTDGRTDITKLKCVFRYCAKASEKCCSHFTPWRGSSWLGMDVKPFTGNQTAAALLAGRRCTYLSITCCEDRCARRRKTNECGQSIVVSLHLFVCV